MSVTQPDAVGPCAPSAEEVDSVMLAARVLVGVTAQSAAAFAPAITLPQFRILVLVASRASVNVDAVARELGVHPSNATRACDKLVRAGLLTRQDDPSDRRNLVLGLSDRGRDLVDRVMGFRRSAIRRFLSRMPAEHRRALAPALRSFAAAGGEVPDSEARSLGWFTGPRGATAAD